MIRAIGLIFAASAVLASPAPAQLMGATELKVAVPVKGAAKTKPVADVYYLAGESGAKETYSFAGKGPASLTLFGPDGSEILSASGSGTVKLEAVLPFTDVFTVSVARKTPAQAYTLTRNTTVPTLTEALFARNVGYASKDAKAWQCWVIPGVKLRLNYINGLFREDALAADRETILWMTRGGPSGVASGDRVFRLVGSELHRISRSQSGKVTETPENFDLSYSPERNGAFTGYLCKS